MQQRSALQRSIDLGHPCIVHQDIDSRVSVEHRFNYALCRRLARKVLIECQYSRLVWIEFSRAFVDALCRRCDHDVRARRMEATRDSKPDTLRAAHTGNQRDLVCECMLHF
jgi:hypothetical protein